MIPPRGDKPFPAPELRCPGREAHPPMDTYRAFLAIVLSFAILLGYQFFFGGLETPPVQPPAVQTAEPQAAPVAEPAVAPVPPPPPATYAPQRTGRDIPVETTLFRAVLSESGGTVKSFQLKQFKESNEENSNPKELITTSGAELPLGFGWGSALPADLPLVYTASTDALQATGDSPAELSMTASLPSGLAITRRYGFDPQSYLFTLAVEVRNNGSVPLQGAPALALTSLPFSPGEGSGYIFTGAAALVNGSLEEVKPQDLADDGPRVFSGTINWAAYEGNYFMTGVVPETGEGTNVRFSAEAEKTTTLLSAPADTLNPGESRLYTYRVYFGPKKVDTLKATGYELDRIVNFGWFDLLAKPVLLILNFLYKYVGNYGIAIILVTVLFKLLFWPISQKGMKSMKNMQKVQPKMAKIREKYKDDPTRMNQEVMNLYKTYKVNPLGGCLPMLLQIPVFFALYKVLLQAIELRHAPFMLWITDLAAPDRLPIGFDLPYLGGIPVLTLLMGASMFLQQKMTPTAADPAQAKVMLFLPVIFTFLFLNFASGLVLYWFVNNLLSIGQQYLVNRQTST